MWPFRMQRPDDNVTMAGAAFFVKYIVVDDVATEFN